MSGPPNASLDRPNGQEDTPAPGVPKLTALDELEAIYATVPVGLCVLDTNLRYVRINNLLAEIHGISVADHLGKTVREIVPDLADEVEKLLHQILVTGEPVHDVELTGETRAQPGVKRTWLEQWLPLKNNQDQVIGINIVAEEITERKRMEEALRLSRQKADQQQEELQAVLEQAPVAIVIYRGPEYIIELANPLVRTMWGRTKEEVLGCPLFEAIPEADTPEFRALLDRIMRTGEPFVGNEVPISLDQFGSSEVQYYNFVYQRWQNEQGIATGVIAIASLVTKQVENRRALETKQAELECYREQLALTNQELALINEELRAANEDLFQTNDHLQRVNTDLDNFVYTASHDLKAPISNIKGLLGLLEQSLSPDSKESPRTQMVLQMMEKSVARFMNTIADLSDITRLQKQSDQPTELVDLAAVIQEVLMDIAPVVEKANARVLIDVTECLSIRFTPKNLRSVVYNLLSNAVKYHDPQRPPVVRVRCEATDGYQIFTVVDNGLGMDLTGDTKLFGMFQRLHDHVEGTGVGLYIVKKVIENAGGRIEVESEVGRGSTFRVFFKQ